MQYVGLLESSQGGTRKKLHVLYACEIHVSRVTDIIKKDYFFFFGSPIKLEFLKAKSV